MLNRRKVLATGIASIGFSGSAIAGQNCTYPMPGFRRCGAFISAENIPAISQECPYWCWAACIQICFAAQGFDVDQETIVERVYPDYIPGTKIDQCYTATGPQMAQAVNSENWTTSDGTRNFKAVAEPLYDSQEGVRVFEMQKRIIDEVSAERPVIIGALGHGTALVGLEYHANDFGNGEFLGMWVQDPLQPAISPRFLTTQEFYGSTLAMAISTSEI